MFGRVISPTCFYAGLAVGTSNVRLGGTAQKSDVNRTQNEPNWSKVRQTFTEARNGVGFSRAPLCVAELSRVSVRLRLRRGVTGLSGLTKKVRRYEPRSGEGGTFGKGS